MDHVALRGGHPGLEAPKAGLGAYEVAVGHQRTGELPAMALEPAIFLSSVSLISTKTVGVKADAGWVIRNPR